MKLPAAPGQPVASPCINVCAMDEATGWCAGCLRTLDEIAGWSRLDEPGKRAMLAELPARRSAWRARAGAAGDLAAAAGDAADASAVAGAQAKTDAMPTPAERTGS